jgi:Zn finger protein HypA/HybF involved in hydrogenase expression
MKIMVLLIVSILLVGCTNKTDTTNKNIEFCLDDQRYYIGNLLDNPSNGYLPGHIKCENCKKTLYIWVKKGYEWKNILPEVICPNCGVNICTIDTIKPYEITKE